jgi:hypothetical protein
LRGASLSQLHSTHHASVSHFSAHQRVGKLLIAMASNVTVILEDARRILVKTTPSMPLNAILKEACEKAKIPDTAGYGLK